MAFGLQRSRNPGKEIFRVLQEQLTQAGRAAGDAPHPVAERARQARVACKKMRATLELVRGHNPAHFKPEDRCFRDAARTLAEIRDHGAVLTTLQRLRHQPVPSARSDRRSFRRVQEALDARPQRNAGTSKKVDAVFQTFRRKLKKARARLDHIRFKGEKQNGFAFIEAGFLRSYARARTALREANESANDDAVHTWRKRTKTHLNQCRLLKRTCPGIMPPRVRELEHLSSLLGEAHDLVVLRERIGETVFIAQDQRTVKLILQQIDRRLTALKSNALAKGKTIFFEKARPFVTRVETDWDAAHSTAVQRGSKTARSREV